MSSVNPFEQNVDIYNKKISSSKTINTNQSSEVSESAQIDTSGSIYSESSDSKQYSNGLSVENDSEIDSNTYNVIKEQLENEIEQKKQALKDKKDDRGWATSLWNSAKELFGGGDKAELKEIEKLEEELKTLETEPDNLDAVYKSIMGKDLSAEEISKIKNSSSLVSSLDSSTKQAIITELENQYEQIEDSLDSAKSSNGWISGAWDKFKNWTGIGASSNKSETQLDNMKEQLDSLKENPDNLAEVYKNITGKDFTTDELNKFISGETSLVSESKAAESVSKYSEGQKMATDIVADVVSGIAAVGAIAAAPFTGGASLLLAAGVGAGVKVGLKASDCIGNEKTYGLSDLAYDSVTGSINGMFAPISNGLGGAAGTGVAKAFGLEAAENTVKTALKQTAKTVGKEAAEEVLEQGAKQAGKSTISKILAKQGTEYVLKEGAESTLKTTIGKVAAYGTDMVVDGALSGATDGFARALGEGRIEDIPQDTLNGLAGGAVASPLIGGGFRLATKGGSKIGNMIGKSDIGDSVADEVSDKSKSSFLNKAGELKDAASDKLHKAGDKIKNSNAYQKAGELKHAASDKLHQAGDKIKNSTAYQKAGELKDAAKDKFHQMAEEYNSTRELMAEDGVSFKDLAADKLHQTGDKIKNSTAYQKAGELKHAASDKLHQAGDKIKNSKAYQKAGELKDSMKTSIKSKLKETKVGKKLVQDYKIAKNNFMNIPQNNSTDAQLVQDLAQFAKKAQEFLDSSNTSLNNHFTNFENTFSNLTTSVDDVIGDISSIRNKILVSSSEKSAMVKELLEEIRAGKDVSPKIIELIDKGIDLTDLFDENLLKVTTDLEDKLGKVSTYSQEYNKSVENLMEILSERTDEATGLANETINVIKKVPDTNAFKQLGDLPDRTKIFATKIQEDISSLKSKSEAAKAKILGGNIEEGLQDLEKYYDEVEVFQSKLEQASIDAQTTAERSGFIETISTLKDRIQSKLNSQGFSSMSKTAQTQSIIEESNIAFSKFIQTMSSDENLPPQVQSFFKEFTSNCTVTRDLAEAQKFADELYGAGKYTLKKSFGAGTVGETYLVTDAEGKEFVMKMLKKGVSEEKFEADRAMFTKYIEEFISDEADKEYKLKLINGLFDSWEKELDYGLEAAGAKNMLDGAKRFNVAQTVEIGTKEGRNISLVMEKADGVGLDTLLDLLKFKNENPTDYMTKSILNDEGKELNPWIKNKKLIEQNSWIKDTESYREALPVAYQKAQNEQAMFLSKKGIKTVHADPHGGNVFVDFDTKTKTPKITYIDTGNVVQRTNSEVLSDISLSLNMLIGNSEGIAHSLIQGATLPAGATQEEMAKKMADLLDERLYKAGINLKDVNYTQSTINNIMKELNIIPDAGNSNLMKATLQRIKTSREIFSVTGTEANKAIDIKDMLKGIAQSFKTNPKETYKTIKPIIKWAYKNKDQTLITFFQMMLKNSDFENIN